MQYSRKKTEALYDRGKKLKLLFFWGHKPSRSGDVTASCFSQWWISPFTVNGITYASAEHWMMAGKARLFEDNEMLEKILQAKSPAEAKKFGRQVRNFDLKTWDEQGYDLVVEGNYHKFSQHPDLKAFLTNTGKRVLVEASPVDPIWGIGLPADHEFAAVPPRWRGKNLLGFALMEVRDRLLKKK